VYGPEPRVDPYVFACPTEAREGTLPRLRGGSNHRSVVTVLDRLG
jgi:hypothetical protein